MMVFLLLLAWVMLPAVAHATKPGLGTGGQGILYTCPKPPRTGAQAAAAAARMAEGPALLVAPLEDTFILHSYPSSNQKLFIDFDGYKFKGNFATWDIDGDPETF